MDRPGRSRPLLALFALSLLTSGVILFTPGAGGAEHFRHEDKVVHAAIFAAPTALGLLGGLVPAVLLPSLLTYAAASEAIQASFLPSRSGSVRDWLADLAGIGLGLLLAAVVARRRHTRQ